MVVRLILSVVVGLTLSLSPAVFAMKQLELKSHSSYRGDRYPA